MAKNEDEDTAPLTLPEGQDRSPEGQTHDGDRAGRELSRSAASPTERWQDSRTYEFSSPEVLLVYIACAVAVSLVTGVWPVVELCRERVAVRLAAGEAGAQERLTLRELSGWARKLGAREVDTEDGT